MMKKNAVVQKGSAMVLVPVRWDALLSGVAVALAIQLLLGLFGLMGVLSVGRAGVASGISAVPWAAQLWQGFCTLVGVFAGAYLAVCMAGLQRKIDGLMHGLITWAAVMLLLVCFSCTSANLFLGGVFQCVSWQSSQLNQLASPGSGAQAISLAALLDANTVGLSPPTSLQMAEWRQLVEAGEREQSIAFLVHTLNMPALHAGVLADQALIMSGNPERASADQRQAAQGALEALNRASWTMLVAVVVALLLGLLGGLLATLESERGPTWV